MASVDATIDKLLKQGRKGKLKDLIKASSSNVDEIRAAVRASAAQSVAEIEAKHCEEYVKKLAFADSDPTVRECAREAFDKLRTRVV